MSISVEGAEVIYPGVDSEGFELVIEPEEDHLIILRRFKNKATYGIKYQT